MISHGKRWKFAFRAFFSLIFHGRIADDILATFRPDPADTPVVVAKTVTATQVVVTDEVDRALQLLGLLQRDGRLVDFLMEDLGTYLDAQIGAAVRSVHSGCRETLARYFTLQPVLEEDEGARITLDRGTDPARVKLVGNIGAAAQFQGLVRHRGWEAARTELPPLPHTGRTIVAPAEVEVA